MDLLCLAKEVAAEAHGSQRRQGVPELYVHHSLRVAERAREAGMSVEAQAAAVLHDVLEDTEVSEDALRGQFPARVVDLVVLLSQWWSDHAPAAMKAREKPRYYARILADPEALAIKLLDRADNLKDMVRGLPHVERWARKYLARTREEIDPLCCASRNEAARREYLAASADLERALAELERRPTKPGRDGATTSPARRLPSRNGTRRR